MFIGIRKMQGLALASALFLATGTTFFEASAQAQGGESVLILTANEIEHVVSVELPENWSIAPQVFGNARSLIDVTPGSSDSPTSELRVYAEPRLDHEDALKQIREAGASVAEESKEVLSVAGWPAMRITRLEDRPQPSQGPSYGDPQVLRIDLYIAVSDMLFVASAVLPKDAGQELISQVQDIGASLQFESSGNPEELGRDLELLKTEAAPDSGASFASKSALPSLFTAAPEAGEADPGAVAASNVRIDAAGRGELEIAVSPDGLNVVVGLQARRFVSSNDGGATFPNVGTVGSGNGDPSIAIGLSGDFYLAWIDTNCGSNYATFNVGTLPMQPFGYDCTGMARSTDGGVTFQTNTVNPAVVCIGRAPTGGVDPAGACFPDQEHIAADRDNPGPGGGDQVYSTWRNFNAANQDAGLVCSQDSGVTWTLPITLGANSFFPRITVGQDGFVYVAAYGGGNYRLWKYDSCASGLNLQAGFPVNVAARTPYACPFPGHDRCDQNPSSQTVAVDDTDASHIYYAYAQDDAEAVNSYSTVVVQDSTDGGLTWPAARTVVADTGDNARRVMPWMCTTNGDAVLTWYEQATPLAQLSPPSDATHHVGAQVGLDGASNLVSKDNFTISEVADNWCDSGWPCGTRVAPSASESCPTQPQLAGFCGDNINGTPDSNIRCDFSDEAAVPGTYCPQPGPSGNNEICLAGNGCPKYGDYNGNACAGQILHAAWPSAASPSGVPGPSTATNTGVLYSTVTLNGPPVCDANGPYTVECGMPTQLDGSGSFDPDGGSLDYDWSGPFTPTPTTGDMPTVTFPEPIGAKTVDLTVTDEDAETDMCSADVTVQDTLDPTITAPDDVVAECTSPDGTPVALGSPVVGDLCDSGLDISDDAPALFPLGDTTVTWTATDDGGNDASDAQIVTIVDTTPPEIFCNSSTTIIPPDAPISFTATAEDICSASVAPVVLSYDCFKFTKKGKRIDKTNSCIVSFEGDTVTIEDSGGVGTTIEWVVEATDGSGNSASKTCSVDVINPND